MVHGKGVITLSIVEEIRTRFKEKVEIFEKSPKRVYVSAKDKHDGREVVRFLFKDLGARMSIASGVDTRPGIEILYHMAMDKHNLIVTVKVLAEKPEPSMPTCTDFMGAASWIEREIHELLGVDFPGHPNLETLLLPDGWSSGFPLRKKSFESEKEGFSREYQ
ncbi:NADH-quinone oxidoreductase subunit C [Candidatus Margulisiibacteriota bacterium]